MSSASPSWPWLLCIGVFTGCAQAALPTAAHVASSAEARAPGVNVTHAPALPRAEPQGKGSSTILVLSAPPSRFGVNTALLRFFEALSAESADGLAAVFEANAQAHFAGGSSTSALGSWLRRFARADYYAISPEAVVHPSRLLTFNEVESPRFKARNPSPLAAHSGEILAQVTIDDPDIALLGNRICFLLRPHPDGYRISATYEDVSR